MVELIIFGGIVLVLGAWLVATHWRSLFWGKDDWRKLRIDNWDETVSRGVVRHRGVHVALGAVRRREREATGIDE